MKKNGKIFMGACILTGVVVISGCGRSTMVTGSESKSEVAMPEMESTMEPESEVTDVSSEISVTEEAGNIPEEKIENVSTEQSSWEDPWYPEHVYLEEENLTIDAELLVPDEFQNGRAEILLVSRPEAECDETVLNLITGGSIPVESGSFTLNGSTGEEILYNFYENQDTPFRLEWTSAGHFSMYTGTIMNHVNSAFHLEDWEKPDICGGESPVFPKSEAEAMSIEFLSTLGIETETLYSKTIFLDHQMLADNEYHINMDGEIDSARYKTDWSEQDDGYYILFWQTIHGARVIKSEGGFSEILKLADFTAQIEIYCQKDGIKEISMLMPLMNEGVSEEAYLISTEDLCGILSKRYGEILTDVTFTAAKMELCYLPVYDQRTGTTLLRPLWAVDLIDSTGHWSQIGIDAVSGNLMYA